MIGAGIYSLSPDLLEFAARGMDWIWLDAQHTHADWSLLIHNVRAAHGIGVPVLVRTWTHDGGTIEKLLDTGAEGIIIPMVDTPEQARAAVAHCFYPPLGNRSFGSVRGECLEIDLDEWNRRIVTVMQIETPKGILNAEAIAEVPGVDALHVGTRDLALRLGKAAHNDTVHGLLKEQIDHVAQVCRKTGKVAAIITLTPEALRDCVQMGYRLICAGFDVDHVEAANRNIRDIFAEVTPK